MDYDTIYLETQEQMDKALQHAVIEFGKLHTGKATPAMLEGLPVDVEAYGTTMPIRDMAAITSPDARTLQVQPWDKQTAGPIERAIRNAGLGFNPVVRGPAIIVPVPELSGERRRELAKIASHLAEEGRVGVRKARHNAMDQLKKLKAEVSEDDIKRYEKEVQEMTDDHVKKINDALEAKEKELLTV
jgi:ribosome recycling factor